MAQIKEKMIWAIHSSYRRQGEERNGKHWKAGGHDFANPRLWYRVTVPYGRHSYLKIGKNTFTSVSIARLVSNTIESLENIIKWPQHGIYAQRCSTRHNELSSFVPVKGIPQIVFFIFPFLIFVYCKSKYPLPSLTTVLEKFGAVL